jgi:integrase
MSHLSLQNLDTLLDNAANVLLYSLSESSQRQYRHSFEKWMSFAELRGISVWDLRPQNLIAFLEHEPLAHSTKSARLAHMRRLLQVLHAQAPENPQIKSLYEQAKMLKVKRTEQQKYDERPKNALSPEQVYRALSYWDGDSKRNRRSKALLAILLYAGLRRSEAVALEWEDIDLVNRLVHVRHGKGDKERTIPLLGGETALNAIRRWKEICGERRFVFCGIRKGDHLDKDSPMTTDGVYKIIQETSTAIGVDFSPHDARRTLLTNGLAAGSSVADMQFIAGHSNPQTTLNYAQVKDANEVRGRVKLNY